MNLVVKGTIDNTTPFPNLIACDSVPEGTILFVRPGERFTIIDLQGVEREVEWRPREVVVLTGLGIPR